MEHAWLDSLSEDWVSQPSEGSPSAILPPLKDVQALDAPSRRDSASRIPRPPGAARAYVGGARDSSPQILSERSASDINRGTGSLRRNPSKLSQEVKLADGDRRAARTVSNSTTGSVVQRVADSPGKSKGQTPEWKRRLLHGDLAYGEQRDLFCSAATGLENIFRPPPPREDVIDEEEGEGDEVYPSSPPHFRRPETPVLDDEDGSDGSAPDYSPSPSPRRAANQVRYRKTEEDSILDESRDESLDESRDESRDDGGPIHADGDGPVTDENPELPNGESRKVSGQSDARNESFSAIFLTQRESGDGKLDFEPQVKPDQLHAKLERLRINQMLFNSKRPDEEDLDGAGPGDASHTCNTTEAFERNGGFINVQRGGRSVEGSSMNRGLSSALATDTSEMLPEDSLQASTPKQFPTIRIDGSFQGPNSPSFPRAPNPSPQKSTGSPLKLFGPYDTFTNQTLMRRISQFEDPRSNSSRHSLDSAADTSAPQANQAFVSASSPQKAAIRGGHPGDRSRSVSQFGAGDLDGYEFSGDGSQISIYDSVLHGDKENISPDDDDDEAAGPETSEMEGGRFSSPDGDEPLVVEKRSTRSQTTFGSRPSTRGGPIDGQSEDQRREIMATPRKRDSGSDSKRPRTTPSKDPTPKRRRTLHRSDIAYGRDDGTAGMDPAQISHLHMQSIMGKKRKDARPGDELQVADASVLAGRQIKNPRSGQSRKSSLEINESPLRSPGRTRSTKQTLSAAPTSPRKPSIRTQDFLDEAGKIMAMIRNQVRPPGLPSMEESENENPSPLDESFQDSTKEPFSRPPSREGRPAACSAAPLQEDPEVANHLKKYQEISDMGDIISSSVRSMGMVRDAIRQDQELERQLRESTASRTNFAAQGEEVYSDPPNIRISGNPEAAARGSSQGDFPSNSSGQSTNRSIPTGSSRCSESRKTIAPQSVSHLIPDQVGSMYLDRDKNAWVKKRGAPKPPVHVLPSEDSQDDPFADIPDLTVDMTMEMRNLRLMSPQKPRDSTESQTVVPSPGPADAMNQSPRGYITLSPDGTVPRSMVSRAREELRKLDSRSPGAKSLQEEEVEHEISIHEDRVDAEPTPSKRKNLTISFSSPIASIIQDVAAEDIDSLEDDAGTPLDGENDAHKSSAREPRLQSLSKSMRKAALSRARGASATRHLSVRGQAFMPRPVSRIEEREDEDSISSATDKQVSIVDTSLVPHGSRRGSLGVVLNTPGKRAAAAVKPDAGSVIAQNVGTLSLSPLSDFTVNNHEQSFGFEVSYVLGERNLVTGDASKKVMSATIRELVDRIAEVEPSEPDWDDLVEMDLHDKRLSSLHALDEFCGRLVKLDASSNALAHLDGVPSSTRELKVSDNLLSELTSWDHLLNLQYIDISNNNVTSLSGLKHLVHLRSLKADNNQLRSLAGIHYHDGLLSVRARDNAIEGVVDFEGTGLTRLTELDLSGNRIEGVLRLEALESLTTLRLQRNRLESFRPSEAMSRLRSLDLTDNNLAALDIRNMPNLHLLHADRNLLTGLTGFYKARHLDSLSLREQRSDLPMDLSFLSAAYEVRKLFLSGNKLESFDVKIDFLNLQLLELANCGLRELPANLGQLMPNLRTLNVNFNALADLSPLRFIPRMKKLSAAGNRLADSTEATELLADFPHLARLDLRDNPVTLGFYPPLQVLVAQAKGGGAASPFELREADAARDDAFASRLDGVTRMRRRLHQVVLAGCCRRLRVLDGLAVDRRRVLARDETLAALVAEGMLLLPGEGEGEDKVEEGCGCAGDTGTVGGAARGDESSRWHAEDSFA